MRRIKILFLFIVLFLLSGCTANYRLSISESGEIEEDIKFLESTSVLKTFSNSIQSDLDKELQNVKQSGIYDSYTIKAPILFFFKYSTAVTISETIFSLSDTVNVL